MYVSFIFIATYLVILIINVNHFVSRRELTVSYSLCLPFRYDQLSKNEKKMLKCYTQCKKQNGIVQLINAHRSTDYAQECKYNCSIHMWLRNIKVKICTQYATGLLLVKKVVIDVRSNAVVIVTTYHLVYTTLHNILYSFLRNTNWVMIGLLLFPFPNTN